MKSTELAERWLLDAAIEITPLFPEPDRPDLADLAIHVGAIPGTRGTSRKTLGTYVPAERTEDNRPAIFVSPLHADSPTVLATLAHELVHHAAITRHQAGGHGKTFGRIARALGLEGPLTATTASERLADELAGVIAVLGEYPIGAIEPDKVRKKQTTRQLKLVCPKCAAILRGTKSSVIPLCDGRQGDGSDDDNARSHAPVRMERETQDDEGEPGDDE